MTRFDTRTLRTQRQQLYVRQDGCARSVVCLLFAVVLWFFSVWRLLVKERKAEKSQRTTANSRHTTLRAQPFSRTYSCWRCVVTFACQIWTQCVRHLVPMVEVEILDTDTTTEVPEVEESLRSCFLEGTTSELMVIMTRRPFRGSKKTFIKLEELHALDLLKAAHIKIGWVSCRVRRRKATKMLPVPRLWAFNRPM